MLLIVIEFKRDMNFVFKGFIGLGREKLGINIYKIFSDWVYGDNK